MKSKATMVIELTVLLIGMLTLAFNIQSAKAFGAIYLGITYIRADGSIDPPTTLIQRDGDIYTFTDDIYALIVVQRSDIIIDGNGFTLKGFPMIVGGTGFNLYGVNNVIIRRTNVEMFDSGIYLEESSNNTICRNNITFNTYGIGLGWDSNGNTVSGNNIANNWIGISLFYSSNNTVSGNNLVNNWDGIHLGGSSNNTVYHNNFVDNFWQVVSDNSINVWDDGFPSGGNYWSDHVCVGNPSFGSQPYIIDENNRDQYPFQDPNGWLLPPSTSPDINGDRTVNIADIVIAALAFGSMEVDNPNTAWDETVDWDSRADLNNDGKVNIIDLVIIGVNFGKRW